jgi:peptide deformylase
VSLLDIHVLGSPSLRLETTPVAEITDALRTLIDDMFETMRAAKGIGLAAPQVGRTERVCVVDVDGERHALINPEVVDSEGSARGEEGCLSIPDVYGDVDRPARCTVRAIDRDGQPFEITDAADLLARCLQHEIDHLHGRLFIDYLSVLKRRAALAKWETLKESYPSFLRRMVPAREIGAHHRDAEL